MTNGLGDERGEVESPVDDGNVMIGCSGEATVAEYWKRVEVGFRLIGSLN